jgi:hypothetical protein
MAIVAPITTTTKPASHRIQRTGRLGDGAITTSRSGSR